jgi:formate hydrogenlyase subunit 4
MTPFTLTVIQLAVILALSPLSLGLVRLFKAWIAGRRGMNPFLPYIQLAIGLRKENLIPPASSWAFASAPYIVLSASIFLAFALPLVTVGGEGAPYSHFILILGVLGIAGVFHAFGAIDAGGAIGGMGASRQTLITALSAPTLLLLFAAFAIKIQASGIDAMIASGLSFLNEPFLILSLISLVLIALAENDRYPVDNPETSLELTMIREAMDFHYSGPYLVMMEYAAMIKLVTFMLLIMNIVFPFTLLSTTKSTLMILPVVAVSVLKVAFMCFLIGCFEHSIAKMRFYRLQEYLASAFFIALAGFALVIVTSKLL